jgi:uncharacterized damage-inducible protein DinB
MRRLTCLMMMLLSSIPFVAQAQDKPADKPAAAAPAAGVRAEFLDEVGFYEQRFMRLAEAIPADKYGWRPAEGVRSIGEVYMHVVSANYGFAKMLGTPFPVGLDPKTFSTLANDKAKVVQGLKDSFAHMRTAIMAIKDSDLDNSTKTPRGPMTVRGAFFLIAGHYGEHLGQSIAYARQIGIVPPWTEERQKQEAEKPKQ